MSIKRIFLFSFFDWLTENKDAFSPGPGLFCWAHIVLMCAMFGGFTALIFVTQKHKLFAKKFGAILCITMVSLRLCRMAIQLVFGGYSFFEILPFQLCHIMCFALIIIYFKKSTAFSLPILIFSVIGGVFTFAFGDYYYINFPSFYIIESIFLHFCLPSIVICYVAIKQPKYSKTDLFEVPIFLLILCAWATFGNLTSQGKNYMYLVQNGLPFNLFPGHHFLLTYLFIAICMCICTWIVFSITKSIKKRHTNNTAKNVEKTK